MKSTLINFLPLVAAMTLAACGGGGDLPGIFRSSLT